MNAFIFLSLSCIAVSIVYLIISSVLQVGVRPAILYVYDRDTHEKITSIEVDDLYDTTIIHKNGSVFIIPSDPMNNETLYFKNAYCEYDEVYDKKGK